MTLHYEDAGLRLFHGSNKDVLPTFEDASFDSIVTDPPYELGFMGKSWDSSGIAYDVDLWRECLRVLKPGGFLLAFGGTRTWHRIAVAIEDAGFEIRDSIAWMYGSGFPKSMDVAKAIDKNRRGQMVREKLLHFADARGIDGKWLEAHGVASAASFQDWTTGGHVPSEGNWRIVAAALEVTPEEEAAFERAIVGVHRSALGRAASGVRGGVAGSGAARTTAATQEAREWEGWGTALKPAFEPIVVARKPLSGTVAANVLAYGTGALNIDACRIPHRTVNGGNLADNPHLRGTKRRSAAKATAFSGSGEEVDLTDQSGRFPANVLLDESQAAALDEQTGILTSGLMKARTERAPRPGGKIYGSDTRNVVAGDTYADSGGASRFFPIFRYEAKALSSERPEVDGTVHATVKPLELMRWLVRLVTRRGGGGA